LHDGYTSLSQKETSHDTAIDAVQYEIFREITPETLAEFDAGQNISDFKENNNSINMVYGSMDWVFVELVVTHALAADQKKGCAARTPNPNREPSGNGMKPSP
jgi:hypothetical protein